MLAYQRSSCACAVYSRLSPFTLKFVPLLVRFWGWTENKREEEMDLAELSKRASEGKPLYGDSDQPMWVRAAAHSNSAFSQLKFRSYTIFFVELYRTDVSGIDAFPWYVYPV